MRINKKRLHTYNQWHTEVEKLKAKAHIINNQSKSLHLQCFVITRVMKRK